MADFMVFKTREEAEARAEQEREWIWPDAKVFEYQRWIDGGWIIRASNSLVLRRNGWWA